MDALLIMGIIIGFLIIFYFPSRSMGKNSPALGALWLIIGLVVAYYVYQNFSGIEYIPPEVDI